MIEFNGERACLADWAERFRMPAHTLATRLRLGWSVKRALTTRPSAHQGRTPRDSRS